MALATKIESLLFVSIRPLSLKELMEKTESKKKDEVESALGELVKKYNIDGSGITVQRIDDKVQMVTSKDTSDMISDYLKSEVTGELTPASLETLTVIAYRGPITKTELELIRGVNCSLIIRNLLIRGMIEERKGSKDLVPTYQITFDFLRYLGLSDVKQLPDYDKLNSDENLKSLLKTPTTDSNEEITGGEKEAVEIPIDIVAEANGEDEEDDDDFDDDDDDDDDDEDAEDDGGEEEGEVEIKESDDKDSLKEEGFDHIDEKEFEVKVEDDDEDEEDEDDEDDEDEEDEEDEDEI